MSVRNRRQAREAALAALYLAENGRRYAPEALPDLESYTELPEELRRYAEQLVQGVTAQRRAIDERIQRRLDDWKLSRLASIDRNILRLACFELFDIDDVPPKVTLDEAIELAKKYSTAESGRFVNGVLGSVLGDSPKANWVPPPAAQIEEAAPASEEPEPVLVSDDAPEVQELAKVGKWQLRSEESE